MEGWEGECSKCWAPLSRPPQAIYAPGTSQTHHAQRAAGRLLVVLGPLRARVQIRSGPRVVQVAMRAVPRMERRVACIRVLRFSEANARMRCVATSSHPVPCTLPAVVTDVAAT